jgi:hypothetical protein
MIAGPSGTNLHLAEELAEGGGYRVTETVMLPPPMPKGGVERRLAP